MKKTTALLAALALSLSIGALGQAGIQRNVDWAESIGNVDWAKSQRNVDWAKSQRNVDWAKAQRNVDWAGAHLDSPAPGDA